jgi:hypothetical protein
MKQDTVIEQQQQVRYFFYVCKLNLYIKKKTFFICVTVNYVLHNILKYFFCNKFFFFLDSLVGKYTCIEVHLALQRNIILYLQQLYLPSTLIVALSFIAFWIDYKSHPARTLLSLLSIVTITTKAEGTKYILYFFFYFGIHTHTRARIFCLHCFLFFPIHYTNISIHWMIDLS